MTPAPDTLVIRSRRDWGPFSIARIGVSAGRYPTPATAEHRMMLYLSPPVQTRCRVADLKVARLQAPGDFDLLPAGADGVWEDAGAAEMVLFRMAPKLIADVAEGLDLRAEAVSLAPGAGARDGRVEHVVRALLAEAEADTSGARLLADSLATALAAQLVTGFADSGPRPGRTLSKPQMRRVADYVEARLGEDLALADLAAVTGLSTPHFAALFRRSTGRPPHRYVQERRVARAKELLGEGALGQAEIALTCGFSHQSHMARWTRRLLGLTPAQIRKT